MIATESLVQKVLQQSYLAIYNRDPNSPRRSYSREVSQFGNVEEEDIEGLNYIYRGLAIKELLRVNCIKTGTILPIPSSCQYGVPNQYLGAGDTIDRKVAPACTEVRNTLIFL